MAWYREWFGEEYLDLYAHRDRDEAERHVDFFESLLAGAGAGAILDLGCGTGRHTEALRERRHRAVGLDLSLTLLARNPGLPRIRGDMRTLPFAAGSFDWVLNFFTSFGYFESERENFRVLEEVVRVLRPGGRLLIDLLNPEPTISGLNHREAREIDGRRVDIERWYDAAARRINKRIRLVTQRGEIRHFLESVRAYRLEEVTTGLHWAGLEVARTFGGFNAETYEPGSERMILLAAKPETIEP